MACVPIPTETLFDTVITIGQSATFSGSVTTIPPDVTTIVSTTCSVVGDGGPSGSDCVDVPITVVSTIDDGGESTIQVPVVVTFPVTTEIATLTLYAPCPNDPPPPPPPPTPSPTPSLTPSSPAPPDQNTPSTSSPPPLVPTVVTPIPGVFTSEFSSTLPDGNVVWTSVVITSTYPPTSILVPSRSKSSLPAVTSDASQNENIRDILGPVLGGALGGFFGLLGLVGLGWLCWVKRDAIFRFNSGMDEDIPYSYSPEPPLSMPHDEPEPKPYHYGLVGRASSHPSRGGSPPPPSPHSRSTSTPTIVNTGVVVQNVASAAAGASPTAALTGRRMSASSNANLNLAVPTDQQVSLRKRSPTPSQSLHSQSPSFSQSTRTPSRTSHLSMNPTGALIVASSSGATGAALGSTQRLRVTPSPTFPGASSIPPAAISPGLTPRSNHPSYSSSRPSMSRLSATSSIAGPSQLQPQPSPGSQSPRPPSQQQQRPFPAQSPPPPYQDLPSQQSSPPQLSEPERGIPDPRILQQQQLAMLPPGAGPPMMRQSWPRYLSNDGASGEGETAPRREDYDEFGRYLVGTSGNGFREGRTASEGRPYSGIPTRTVSALAASVEMVKGLGRSAMASGSGGGPSQEGKRRAATTSMAFSTSTSTSISSPPPSTPAFPRTSGSKSLLDIQIPSSSMDFGSAVLDQPSGEVGDVQDVDGKEKGKGRADEDPTNEDHAGNEGDERPTSRLKRSSTVDSEVIRALAMERLSGGRQNVLYVVNREASLEGGEEGGAGGQPP